MPATVVAFAEVAGGQSTAFEELKGKKIVAKIKHVGALAGGALVAVGLLVLMMLVVEARPAEATFPGKNGKIAFVGYGGRGIYNIYTINPDGGSKFRVTDNRMGSVDSSIPPSWSPNGKRIAYTGYDGHDAEIFTISATGGSRFNVTDNKTDDLWPTYSPDGKKIAYVAHRGIGQTFVGDSEIYTINVGGGGRAKVTNDNRMEYEPDYSPNGKRIAYASSGLKTSDYNIFTINVGGGGKVKVTNTGFARNPSYSPSGKKIAYSDWDGHNYQIYTIKAGGGGRVQLTNRKTGAAAPSYSPDGKKIAFVSFDGHDFELYTISATGGGKPFNITNNKTDESEPSWGRHP
jgi:TolB protein